MQLAEYCFGTPGVLLIPVEHLSPRGVSAVFAAALQRRAGWSAAHVALVDAGFSRYWQRSTALAAQTRSWPAPRRRHMALLADERVAHPYVQLLNVGAWTLYACDVDPQHSDAELLAYLLAHGDRMAERGEVTQAAVRNAAWWLQRNDAECAAFVRAAQRSTRPDAAAFRLLAAAVAWLRRLHHASLHPDRPAPARAIPDSELSVPPELIDEPPRLVEAWTAVARATVAAHAAAWRAPDAAAATALCEWLAADAPSLLITARNGRIVWDCDTPDRLGALRSELKHCSGVAVRDMHADLRVVDDKTRRCLAALGAAARLPPVGDVEQCGYVYMHRTRGCLAYSLDEPSVDRRTVPAPPFARAMLGARAVHEWAHRAVDAGAVPCAVEAHEYARRLDGLAAQLAAAIAAAPPSQGAVAQPDLDALAASEACPAGEALARLLTRRLNDWRANLWAAPLLDEAERETYVRQNIRSLRAEYAPARRWRLLARYLYEFQYLRFSAVADRRDFFFSTTAFAADFIDSGLLGAAQFDALAAAVADLCDAYAPRGLV